MKKPGGTRVFLYWGIRMNAINGAVQSLPIILHLFEFQRPDRPLIIQAMHLVRKKIPCIRTNAYSYLVSETIVVMEVPAPVVLISFISPCAACAANRINLKIHSKSIVIK